MIATLAPLLFALYVPIASTAAAETNPNVAAPAPTQFSFVNKIIPIATVDTGVTIKNENAIVINIHIKTGCNVVNSKIIDAKSFVRLLVYGNVANPNAATNPPVIGKKIIVTDPNLSLT